MTEGPASEPPQGTPGRRALGAMESAVRRVRESAGEPPLPPPTVVRPPERPAPAEPGPPQTRVPPGRVEDPVAVETPQPSSEGGSRWGDRRGERWLAGAVIAAAVLVVGAAVALAASLSGNGSPAPSPATVAAPTVARDHPHAGNTSGHGETTPSAPSSTSTTSPPAGSSTTTPTSPPSTTLAAPGAAPVIAALNPASGGPGQVVEVAGANFLSTSGQIVATFNGQVAPTSCPAQNTCMVTVPPMTGSSSAQVVITTANGASNPVTFTYS
jgi:DNA segregation ATPase FtsK/SpoIIIE, S-DNA-T family